MEEKSSYYRDGYILYILIHYFSFTITKFSRLGIIEGFFDIYV